jgi:hypothetical protein
VLGSPGLQKMLVYSQWKTSRNDAPVSRQARSRAAVLGAFASREDPAPDAAESSGHSPAAARVALLTAPLGASGTVQVGLCKWDCASGTVGSANGTTRHS